MYSCILASIDFHFDAGDGMSGQGKQAKILSDGHSRSMLAYVDAGRFPLRDRVMVLLSLKAGLRACEIASVTWGMVTDASGQVGDVLALENRASKGKRGGRTIPLHPELRMALISLKASRGGLAGSDVSVIYSSRGGGMSAESVTVWFFRLYEKLGMVGCSSHSGRRTFVTKAAKLIPAAGGSLRDVQQLAGHSSLMTTQRYIEGDAAAKVAVVGMM